MTDTTLTDIIEAHRAYRAHLAERARRDAAILRALDAGMTAYRIAQEMRAALGEPAALTEARIRQILKREKEGK